MTLHGNSKWRAQQTVHLFASARWSCLSPCQALVLKDYHVVVCSVHRIALEIIAYTASCCGRCCQGQLKVFGHAQAKLQWLAELGLCFGGAHAAVEHSLDAILQDGQRHKL